MKEKIDELLRALSLEASDANHEILNEWVRRNCKVVQGVFSLDPLLIGEDKKKQFAYNYTKTCLEIGRFALNSCGEMVKEEANLTHKFDVYKPHILVWDLSVKDVKPMGEIQ